jgi:hypothetical protein
MIGDAARNGLRPDPVLDIVVMSSLWRRAGPGVTRSGESTSVRFDIVLIGSLRRRAGPTTVAIAGRPGSRSWRAGHAAAA